MPAPSAFRTRAAPDKPGTEKGGPRRDQKRVASVSREVTPRGMLKNTRVNRRLLSRYSTIATVTGNEIPRRATDIERHRAVSSCATRTQPLQTQSTSRGVGTPSGRAALTSAAHSTTQETPPTARREETAMAQTGAGRPSRPHNLAASSHDPAFSKAPRQSAPDGDENRRRSSGVMNRQDVGGRSPKARGDDA